jgi:hypothetical protein
VKKRAKGGKSMKISRWDTVSSVTIILAVSISVLATLAAIWAAIAWLVKFCWNEIAPIFGGPTLTFWQALAAIVVLYVAGRILIQRRGL